MVEEIVDMSMMCGKHNLRRDILCNNCMTFICNDCISEHRNSCRGSLELMKEFDNIQFPILKKEIETVDRLGKVLQGFKEKRLRLEHQSKRMEFSEITAILESMTKQIFVEIMKITNDKEIYEANITRLLKNISFQEEQTKIMISKYEDIINSKIEQEMEVLRKKTEEDEDSKVIESMEQCLITTEMAVKSCEDMSEAHQILQELNKSGIMAMQIRLLENFRNEIGELKEKVRKYDDQTNILKQTIRDQEAQVNRLSQQMKEYMTLIEEFSSKCWMDENPAKHLNCCVCSNYCCKMCYFICNICGKGFCNNCTKKCNSCRSPFCKNCVSKHKCYSPGIRLPASTRYLYSAICDKDLDHLWRYDITNSKLTNTLEPIPPYGRILQINDRIFLTGGVYQEITRSNTREFKETINAFVNLAGMLNSRSSHCMLSLDDNNFCVIGGIKGSSPFSDCEKYSITQNKWEKMPSLNNKIWGASGVRTSEHRIYIFGGSTSLSIETLINSIESIDAQKLDQWKILDLVINESVPSYCSLLFELPKTKEIYIFSGIPSNKFLIYNPTSKTIKINSSFSPESDGFLQSSLIGDKIYSIGYNGNIHIYTISTNSYKVITQKEAIQNQFHTISLFWGLNYSKLLSTLLLSRLFTYAFTKQ